MASQQTLDQHFPQIKPKSASNFYGKKEYSPLKESTCVKKPKEVYKPVVRKLISFSSDESESDSDTENVLSSKVVTGKKEEPGVSPSKIRKIDSVNKITNEDETQCANPAVYRKAKTPSTHLAELDLSPKKTTKSRRKLFVDKYQEARQALHSAVPQNLMCRETEMMHLTMFVKEHINFKKSGSMYISGPPGTGKTAVLTKISNHFPTNLIQIYVNCTTLKSPIAIYAKICDELKLVCNRRASKFAIEEYLSKPQRRTRPILLILDEIDNLESKNQSVLYTIFEWPSIPNSKFILIGISNTLDLTDRVLPRLQARSGCQPRVMHFAPYTNEQIVSIISDRLKNADVSEIFSSNALNLLARKVSAMSGDIRKTLDICRMLFEYAERKRNIAVLLPKKGQETDSTKEIVKVEVTEVLAILNQIYGGSQNIDEAEDKFPLQQKVLLCSLILLLNNGRNKDVTIGRLYKVYKNVCKKRKFNIVDNSEFVNLCSLIETRGIIRLALKKDTQLSKVFLEWDQDQLNAAFSDKNLTCDIMNDVSCL